MVGITNRGRAIALFFISLRKIMELDEIKVLIYDQAQKILSELAELKTKVARLDKDADLFDERLNDLELHVENKIDEFDAEISDITNDIQELQLEKEDV